MTASQRMILEFKSEREREGERRGGRKRERVIERE